MTTPDTPDKYVEQLRKEADNDYACGCILIFLLIAFLLIGMILATYD